MFTGIIEAVGQVEQIFSPYKEEQILEIKSPLSSQLSLGQSLSHNGACLTVEKIEGHVYQVRLMSQTLAKTMFSTLKKGDVLNLERSLALNARLDGHFVQGHIDAVGWVEEIRSVGTSKEFRIRYPKEYLSLVIAQGSIAVNGMSLTVAETRHNDPLPSFKVSIIPYTYENTNTASLGQDSLVNLEFDIFAKYLEKMLLAREGQGPLT